MIGIVHLKQIVWEHPMGPLVMLTRNVQRNIMAEKLELMDGKSHQNTSNQGYFEILFTNIPIPIFRTPGKSSTSNDALVDKVKILEDIVKRQNAEKKKRQTVIRQLVDENTALQVENAILREKMAEK